MTVQYSQAATNTRLDAVESTIGTAPRLRFYDGTMPADCATALSGNTMLAEVVLPSDWLSAAYYGCKSGLSAPWWCSAAAATGVATFFRIYDSSAATCHVQGNVTAIGGGGSIEFNSTRIVKDYPVVVTNIILRLNDAPGLTVIAAITLGNVSLVGTASAAQYSIETGRTAFGNDYVDGPSGVANGTIFSGWFLRTDAVGNGGYPWSSGNREFFDLNYANWRIRFIGFNSSATSSGDTNCWYNSNSMIMADGTAVSEGADSYAGDYSYMGEGGHTVAELGSWTFFACQTYNDSANSQIVIRMWVKFFGGTLLGPYSTTLTYAQLRSDLQANAAWTAPHAAAWTPSTTVNGFTAGLDPLYGLHLRVETNTGSPSNAYIDAISALTAPDGNEWADWQFNWQSGAANLTDRGSNGTRALSIHAGGTLYQGPVGPW